MVLPHLFGVLASLIAVAGVRSLLPAGQPFLQLAASLAACFAASVLVVAAFPHGRRTIGQLLALLAGPLQRARVS
jgi:hypothetical protein